MMLEIHALALDRHKNEAGLNLLMRSQLSPSLNYWITYKQMIKKTLHRIASTQTDHIRSHK